MHYEHLIIAHRAFYNSEVRPIDYEDYISQKNWDRWNNPILPMGEIEKLFSFIKRWDFHFKGDPEVFRKRYEEVYSIIEILRQKSIENVDLNEKGFGDKIQFVFDKVANCCSIKRYESTDASKMLHTIIPDFFIMWDYKIRKHVLGSGERYSGRDYSFAFLPQMKMELEEAIETCMNEKQLDRKDTIDFISSTCNENPLAKLVDEYNFMVYTVPDVFQRYIEKNNTEISPKQYESLKNKIVKPMKDRGTPVKRIKISQKEIERKKRQKEFNELINLLNTLKGRGIISAVEWREYNRQWRESMGERKASVMKELRYLLGNYKS